MNIKLQFGRGEGTWKEDKLYKKWVKTLDTFNQVGLKKMMRIG